MAAMLYRFGDETLLAMGTPTFSDVPATHPFIDEIEWLAREQIAGGFADGSFRPGGAVTRQAMAAFLVRYSSYLTMRVPPG
jgi:hypothetical protein